MNRLVIIGNGFDLAHGLPTRYKDFIEDYLCNSLTKFLTEENFDDLLISINYINSYERYADKNPVTNYDSAIELIEILKSKHYIDFKFNSHFFWSLTQNLSNLNWVDVENEYFEALNSCRNTPNGFFHFETVDQLNIEFDYIKKLLEEYLSKTINNFNSTINPNKYSRIFCQHILKEEVLLDNLGNDIVPQNMLLLNFNYTPLLESYYDKCNNIIPTDVNYIHGELENVDNPIIFGFGDEYDKDYKDFEDKKNNSLFEHIKSFGYFKTKNYHNLIRFLDSDDYQVYIVGHSCGLSDRTMLKEIFENEKCKSIKIFYHQRNDGTNDYREKTMEISRHFEDKGLMRKKIVTFELSKNM